jgi:hypothetical protein
VSVKVNRTLLTLLITAPVHLEPPAVQARNAACFGKGADFCVALIVEKFHVPCASLISSTLGRCKLSELISTDLRGRAAA